MLCLSTQFNRSLWLPPFLLFFCFTSNVFASVAPTATINASSGIIGSMESYCQANVPVGKTFDTVLVQPSAFSSVQNIYRVYLSAQNGGTVNTCKATDGSSFGSQSFTAQYCLSSEPVQTITDGILSCGGCPPGTEDNNGTCEPPPACPEANTFFGGGSTDGDSLTGCNGSCELQSGGSCIATTDPVQGITTSTFCGGWRYSGNSCETNNFTSGSSPSGVPSNNGGRPTKPSDCPPQTGYAEVNGEASCLPSGSTVDGGTATSTDPTTGNTTTTDIKTTINPDGTRTTTTTTSIFDSGGALISTSTGTSTNSGISDGQGKEPQKIDLDFGESPTFDSTLPEEPQIQIKTQAGQTITTEVFSVAASCPADIVFEALGQEFTISFVPICDLADIIRGIILMLASIASIRIVVSS